tara:strand:- start:5464 stop:6603 length:1140 start_codon:yes stop_codon:yes gene_type:complete
MTSDRFLKPYSTLLLLAVLISTMSCATSDSTQEGAATPQATVSSEPPQDTRDLTPGLFDDHAQSIADSNQEIDLAAIPGGVFQMGGNSAGMHAVELDSFWISKHEVSWDQYNLFLEDSIQDLRRELYKVFYNVDIETADAVSAPTWTEELLEFLRDADIPADVISIPSPAYGDLSAGMGESGYPAVNITHYAALMYTKWLTVKTGDFYRLPTEAEWEYACRAGNYDNYTPYYVSQIDQYAWHAGNSDRTYQPVDSKLPNPFGIYNMLGNVAEWTMDQYHEDYLERLEGEPANNPWFKPDELYPRAVRGGSWMDQPDVASCLQRRGSDPSWKRNDPQLPKSLWWHTNAYHVGFRVVKPKNQPSGVTDMEKWWIEAIQDFY